MLHLRRVCKRRRIGRCKVPELHLSSKMVITSHAHLRGTGHGGIDEHDNPAESNFKRLLIDRLCISSTLQLWLLWMQAHCNCNAINQMSADTTLQGMCHRPSGGPQSRHTKGASRCELYR